MKKRMYSILAFVMLTVSISFSQEVKSPDGNIQLLFSVSENGEPIYKVNYKGINVIKASKLGLELKAEGHYPEFGKQEEMMKTSSNPQSSLYDGFNLVK